MADKKQTYHIPEFEAVSEEFHAAVLDALRTVEEQSMAKAGHNGRKDKQDARSKNNILKSLGTFRKLALPMAAMLVLVVGGITVYGAIAAYKERLAQMDQGQIEDYYSWQSQGETMHYSRLLRESEQTRYEQLNQAYETEGLFPEGTIAYLEDADDYTGEGIGLLTSRATFMLPQEDLTDEELLQLIDYAHKADYSFQQIQKQVADGGDYPDWRMETPAADGDQIIAYEGDVDMTAIALGQNCFYLAGTDRIERMPIGGSVSEPYYTQDFGNLHVMKMAEDGDEGLYVLLKSTIFDLETAGKNNTARLLHLDRYGAVLFDSELLFDANRSQALLDVSDMAVDQKGNLYLSSFEAGGVIVLDGQGTEIRRIEISYEVYDLLNQDRLCCGKDGAVYLATMERIPEPDQGVDWTTYRKEHPFTNTILLRLDPDSETGFAEVGDHIIPEQVAHIAAFCKGVDTDFAFFYPEGIYTYNPGDKAGKQVMAIYEAPLAWEDSRFFVLADGRMVFVKKYDSLPPTTEGELTPTTVPESIRFFYVSAAYLRNK